MAGVFINYRAADNPYGPAGIHDGLVRLFGPAKVFRDCVSMGAGTVYPSAIRQALATAEVVIAVIGPKWLTATDETTGERLIDRSHDWVRRELSWAFDHGTHVVPVVLKDTPEDATLPPPAELPPDIRPLAYIQALAFSQRRFGADLDRLADTLHELVPTLGATPVRFHDRIEYAELSGSPFFEVVDALHRLPCMRDGDTRSLVVGRLPTEISFAIQGFSEPRAHIAEILRKCVEYDGGVPGLLSVIRDMNGDSIAWRHLLATLQRRSA
jgi:hypothetical protein